MPKEITHWLIAEQVAANIKKSGLKQMLQSFVNIYRLGSVLPDSFLYMKFGPHAKTLLAKGQAIHEVDDSFVLIKEYIAGNADDLPDEATALLLGMTTHFYADCTFHPFTHFMSGNNTTKHFTLETYADLHFAEGNVSSPKWLMNNLLAGLETNLNSAAGLITKIFWGESEDLIDAVSSMLKQHAYIQSRFNSSLVRALLQFIDSLPGIDLKMYRALFYPDQKPDPASLFPRSYTYHHPVTNVEYKASLKNLKDKAVNDLVVLFDNMSAGADLSFEPLYSLNMNSNTGMYRKKSKDMKYFSTEPDIMKIIF